jgi:hypothetical protein
MVANGMLEHEFPKPVDRRPRPATTVRVAATSKGRAHKNAQIDLTGELRGFAQEPPMPKSTSLQSDGDSMSRGARRIPAPDRWIAERAKGIAGPDFVTPFANNVSLALPGQQVTKKRASKNRRAFSIDQCRTSSRHHTETGASAATGCSTTCKLGISIPVIFTRVYF